MGYHGCYYCVYSYHAVLDLICCDADDTLSSMRGIERVVRRSRSLSGVMQARAERVVVVRLEVLVVFVVHFPAPVVDDEAAVADGRQPEVRDRLMSSTL